MKRVLIILTLVLPVGMLATFALLPDLDPTFAAPLFHFYIVTFFTFTAAVVALFADRALGQQGAPRHRLLATAFAIMGALFLIHGIATPSALIFTVNPGLRWAAWLTLLIGGIIFALAGHDRPQRPFPYAFLTRVQWVLALFFLVFLLVVVFVPEWLTAIDAAMSAWQQPLAFLLSLLIWLYAAFRLTQIWRETNDQVDGVMALIAAWMVIATVSMHQFPTYQLSWWLYHVELLLGAGTAVYILFRRYEQLRRFNLTAYFAAAGLVVTAALALLTSLLFSQIIEQRLVSQINQQALQTGQNLVMEARFTALVIAGLLMGLLYLGMLVIVQRADGLISARNQELRRAYADLQAAEAMRDDLADMIVHDLRSPLTSISLSLDLLEKSLADPHKAGYRAQFFSGARGSLQRMMQLINQLLDVARMEAGRLQIDPVPFSITGLLEEKAKQFELQAESAGKSLVLAAPGMLPPISADRELVGRVLDNLIGNALKHTSHGGHVTLNASGNGQVVVVEVTDDGEGIPPEAAAHIFDKFYQVQDDAGKPVRRGTGLGLAFCKLVVEAHNGRIWVESTPGQGSTFSFTLPQIQ